MLTNLKLKAIGQRAVIVAALCGVAFSVNSISQVAAQPDTNLVETVVFDTSLPVRVDEIAVRGAVETFIRGMKNGDAQTAWMFASEEDQAAFGTEAAVHHAFAETFPALTSVQEVRFDSFSQEGDTPFVQLSLKDTDGTHHQADIGLWLDDAGDWKLISCEVTQVSDRVASL